jgi:hypothetical protein
MRRWWCVAAVLLCAGGASAQDAVQADASGPDVPVGAPQPDRSVRDVEFGVVARHFGLERRVEMYQWRAAGLGYLKGWSAQPIDSTGFAPGHANPPFPLQGRRWLAKSITIDGKPLDAEVIAGLGQWRDFRPGFSALPGNLAVTFQPEGDGLGSAENPLDPQIGDLRIHWRELMLPPLQDRVTLREGRWRLLAPPAADAATADSGPAPAEARPKPRRAPWLFGGGALIALVAALAARRRRRAASKTSGE